MMFSKEDLEIPAFGELLEFLPIVVFIGLVAPFLLAAYAVGGLMDATGWIHTD
jgi:hypothetical protein